MTQTQFTTKPRFEILDGLRGVAAIIVVAFHLFETYSSGPCAQMLNHGYLAVDFFFILSGFVIGYAYDDRWGKGMTQWDFYKRRIARLQPMVVMGSLIGAFWFFLGDAPMFGLVNQSPWWLVMVCMVMGSLMIPTPPSMDIRGWQEINSLNGSQWSLMWEYVANVLYATVVHRFSKVALTILVALSGVMTLDICLNTDIFGLLGGREYAAYTLIGGFGLSPDQIYIGVARLIFPFFGGLLIYRLGKRVSFGKRGFLWCSLILAAMLCAPHIGGDKPNIANGIYNAATVMIIFPLIVAAGAGSPLLGDKTTRVCKFLGEISYPLYITHYPMIYVHMNWVARHPDSPLGTHIWVAVWIFIAAIAVAYASLKVYDLPVRAWLKEHWLKRR